MPVNRNTLLRYKTIDRMLRKGRKVTLDELIDACNDALYETNGYGEVSRRTIQHDIQEMRYSQALGYYAPIKVVDKKYYMYSEYGYSITQIPLSAEDMAQLSEAVDLLKQMSSFKGFDGVEDVVNRLEDYVASMRYKAEPVILLESNERLRGLEYITDLHDAIMNKEPIAITYKSFRSAEAQTFCFSPYILKEFRNRWWVFGDRHDFTYTPLCNLALVQKYMKGVSLLSECDRIHMLTDEDISIVGSFIPFQLVWHVVANDASIDVQIFKTYIPNTALFIITADDRHLRAHTAITDVAECDILDATARCIAVLLIPTDSQIHQHAIRQTFYSDVLERQAFHQDVVTVIDADATLIVYLVLWVFKYINIIVKHILYRLVLLYVPMQSYHDGMGNVGPVDSIMYTYVPT